MDERYIYGIKLLVKDTERTADWLCDNLFFSREAEKGQKGTVIKNGNIRLILNSDGGEAAGNYDPDAMCLGLRHVALETCDIRRAIEYCKSRGLNLQLNDQGGARHSGKVYGTGMDYFNILTDFGFTVEVSQKLHCERSLTGNIIEGLEHVGMQVANMNEAVDFYEKLGFKREFEPVINQDNGSTVICCMVSAGGTTMELYEFQNVEVKKSPENAVMEALVLGKHRESQDGAERKMSLITGIAGERIEMEL